MLRSVRLAEFLALLGTETLNTLFLGMAQEFTSSPTSHVKFAHIAFVADELKSRGVDVAAGVKALTERPQKLGPGLPLVVRFGSA